MRPDNPLGLEQKHLTNVEASLPGRVLGGSTWLRSGSTWRRRPRQRSGEGADGLSHLREASWHSVEITDDVMQIKTINEHVHIRYVLSIKMLIVFFLVGLLRA